jgi:predicted branched-subunit amino acid permease
MVNAGNDVIGLQNFLCTTQSFVAFSCHVSWDARCLLGSVFMDSAQGELPSKLDFFSLSLMIVIRWRQLPRHLLHSC